MSSQPLLLDLRKTRLDHYDALGDKPQDAVRELGGDELSRFRQALKEPDPGASSLGQSGIEDDACRPDTRFDASFKKHRRSEAGGREQPEGAPGIFGLFSASTSSNSSLAPLVQDGALPAPQGADALPSAVRDVVSAVADRLLVCTEVTQEVRMQIKPNVLPGVEVRVAQDAGRWAVSFYVQDATSLSLLNGAREHAAAALAQRLRQEVDVRVTAVHSGDEDFAEAWRLHGQPVYSKPQKHQDQKS